MGKLTTAKAKSIKKPGRYLADPTLFLNVAPGGSKSWVQRLTVHGRRKDIGLGGFPLTSLSAAREAAFTNRQIARSGGDPLVHRRKARIPTFGEAALKTHEANKPRWRNEKVKRNWWQILERHAFPRLGDLRVDEIDRMHVLTVLTPLWTVKPETARRVRRNIRATLQWAMAHGYVETNVAGEAIDGALPAMPAVKAHFRALPYQEVPAALDTVEASGASLAAKLCLRFLVLTTARSGEARAATWAEINPESRTWTVPASKMKGGKEHRVPLSDAVVTVLEQARPLRDRFGLVFPAPMKPGRPLSDMSLTKLLRDTGLATRATVHGFRSSFRDWCAETGKSREIAEAALAHTVGGVEGAYFRSDLFQRRRQLMDQWSAYLAGSRGKVVKIHG